ncbi:uncharacterized protein LOC131942332 [Physella acuta]|uniref:uncharacterized protein LOC131942332 n=1 Tax=Physella acuta TaxID=109671 RepID=UPI0027DEA1DB|nr:uncharacterized protein LOC131942332 [Physella acuta]
MASSRFTKEMGDSDLFLGTHEVQECIEGQTEADLHTHVANCKKNPGHTGFIPVKKFRKEHLPPGYQDSDIYDVINAFRCLTVQISVKFTSLNRPEFEFDTEKPYPCYKYRGKKELRNGTGKIWRVYPNLKEFCGDGVCPCPECKKLAAPHKNCHQVWVVTARHVIFDSTEARQSSCRLWFDDDQSPVVKIYGLEACGISYSNQDFSNFVCVTHDLDIVEKLLNCIRRYKELWGKVQKKYASKNEVDKVAIVVSHPHGCAKQVSVGHWVHRKPVGAYTRYTYTTCTCPGSSGAPVYRLGWTDHPHTGVNSKNINYSASQMDYDFSFTGEDLDQLRLNECDPTATLAFSNDTIQSIMN